jgi:hypothetical protein
MHRFWRVRVGSLVTAKGATLHDRRAPGAQGVARPLLGGL